MPDKRRHRGILARMKKYIFGDPLQFWAKGEEPDPSDDTPYGEFDVPAKLMMAVRKAYDDMEWVRQLHRDAVRQYVGVSYGSEDPIHSDKVFAVDQYGVRDENSVPINMHRKMVKIYMRLLSSGIPQMRTTARFDDLKAFAENFGLGLNQHLREIDLHVANESAVLNSMFSFGILKTAVAGGKDEFESEGVLYDPGDSFTISVHPGNYVVDMEADCYAERAFEGDRYKMPTMWVEEMRDGDYEAAAETLEQSYMAPEERVSGVRENTEKSLYRETWCWDVYLPKQNIVCLFEDNSDTALLVARPDCPERGPYDMIGYDWVPGEVLPSSPVSYLMPMHKFANAAMRKIRSQTERQKTIVVHDMAYSEDAEAMRDTSDGEMVGIVDPSTLQEVRFGGPDPAVNQMVIQLRQWYDEDAGNLALLGGTSAMSVTATQDQLMHKSANVLIDSMRQTIQRVLTSVGRKHAWYLWTEPIRNLEYEKEIPGTGLYISDHIDPEVREGDFLDYNFDIVPHTLQERTPEEEIQKCMEFLMGLIRPTLPMMQQAGRTVDIVGFVEETLKLANLDVAMISMDPEDVQPEEPGEKPWPAQFKHTENVRTSRTGTTMAGNTQKMLDQNASLIKSNATA